MLARISLLRFDEVGQGGRVVKRPRPEQTFSEFETVERICRPVESMLGPTNTHIAHPYAVVVSLVALRRGLPAIQGRIMLDNVPTTPSCRLSPRPHLHLEFAVLLFSQQRKRKPKLGCAAADRTSDNADVGVRIVFVDIRHSAGQRRVDRTLVDGGVGAGAEALSRSAESAATVPATIAAGERLRSNDLFESGAAGEVRLR